MLSNLIENIPDQTISKNIADILSGFTNNKLSHSVNVTIHTKGDAINKDLYLLLKTHLSNNLKIEKITDCRLEEKWKDYKQYNFNILLKNSEYMLEIESLIKTFLNKNNIVQCQVSII